MQKNRIGVIGSINTDIVCITDTLPNVGETVVGNDFKIMHGGKGANEAVACARLGQSVNLLACVGCDDFSKSALANLQNEGVHITAVEQIKKAKGGIANITVSQQNNQIIVIPGANQLLDEKYIKKYSSRLKECSIVGCQFEVPIPSLLEASTICKQNNIKFVLNPSPIKQYPKQLFDNADYIIVNEVEIKSVDGYDKNNELKVLELYPQKLILTCGSKGCFCCINNKIVNIPAIKVNVVDTTGAGDTFLGSFMVGINNGYDLYTALYFATICSGLKTTKVGAQTGMPTLNEVKKYIKQNKINIKL